MSTTRNRFRVSSSAAAKRIELLLAERARCHEWSGRQRRGERDQRDRAAPAQERKGAALSAIVAAHVFAPVLDRPALRPRNIDVMIAGNDGDIGWRPQLVQPRLRPHIFGRYREIDEVAGHRDMVGGGRLQVARQRLDHLAAVDKFALAVPIDEAEAALAGELLEPRPRGKMQIGEVAEHEHRGMMLRESCREQWRRQCAARFTNCR